MSFFISDAVAATGAPAQGSPMSLILMLVVFGSDFLLHDPASTAEAHQGT
ncbi:preprotein translocase subunit YajC [Klebsiella pneumoniae]|uniref:Preprotein translocase subunit YajC n=1 Tax=Klebsiella pneumoniae TaxID=573 RepID=A0A378AT40_KLEPN|nr:preprotein translocase subunit YajC [Klebsiella pneumoniae]